MVGGWSLGAVPKGGPQGENKSSFLRTPLHPMGWECGWAAKWGTGPSDLTSGQGRPSSQNNGKAAETPSHTQLPRGHLISAGRQVTTKQRPMDDQLLSAQRQQSPNCCAPTPGDLVISPCPSLSPCPVSSGPSRFFLPWGALGGSVLLWGGGRGGGGGRGSESGFVAPCPLLPLGEEYPGSRRLLVGARVLGVGGFGHLLLLAHLSQSVLGVVACCLMACWP